MNSSRVALRHSRRRLLEEQLLAGRVDHHGGEVACSGLPGLARYPAAKEAVGR